MASSLYPYNAEHDQYRAQYLLDAVNRECSAAATCREQEGQCFGVIDVYRVRDERVPGMDWGFFTYCEGAAERDRQSGLSVMPLNEWDALATQGDKE